MPKPKNDKPSSAEVNALRTWLRTQSVSSSQANELVKATRTRHENGAALAAHLKTLKKAK